MAKKVATKAPPTRTTYTVINPGLGKSTTIVGGKRVETRFTPTPSGSTTTPVAPGAPTDPNAATRSAAEQEFQVAREQQRAEGQSITASSIQNRAQVNRSLTVKDQMAKEQSEAQNIKPLNAPPQTLLQQTQVSNAQTIAKSPFSSYYGNQNQVKNEKGQVVYGNTATYGQLATRYEQKQTETALNTAQQKSERDAKSPFRNYLVTPPSYQSIAENPARVAAERNKSTTQLQKELKSDETNVALNRAKVIAEGQSDLSQNKAYGQYADSTQAFNLKAGVYNEKVEAQKPKVEEPRNNIFASTEKMDQIKEARDRATYAQNMKESPIKTSLIQGAKNLDLPEKIEGVKQVGSGLKDTFKSIYVPSGKDYTAPYRGAVKTLGGVGRVTNLLDVKPFGKSSLRNRIFDPVESYSSERYEKSKQVERKPQSSLFNLPGETLFRAGTATSLFVSSTVAENPLIGIEAKAVNAGVQGLRLLKPVSSVIRGESRIANFGRGTLDVGENVGKSVAVTKVVKDVSKSSEREEIQQIRTMSNYESIRLGAMEAGRPESKGFRKKVESIPIAGETISNIFRVENLPLGQTISGTFNNAPSKRKAYIEQRARKEGLTKSQTTQLTQSVESGIRTSEKAEVAGIFTSNVISEVQGQAAITRNFNQLGRVTLPQKEAASFVEKTTGRIIGVRGIGEGVASYTAERVARDEKIDPVYAGYSAIGGYGVSRFFGGKIAKYSFEGSGKKSAVLETGLNLADLYEKPADIYADVSMKSTNLGVKSPVITTMPENTYQFGSVENYRETLINGRQAKPYTTQTPVQAKQPSKDKRPTSIYDVKSKVIVPSANAAYSASPSPTFGSKSITVAKTKSPTTIKTPINVQVKTPSLVNVKTRSPAPTNTFIPVTQKTPATLPSPTRTFVSVPVPSQNKVPVPVPFQTKTPITTRTQVTNKTKVQNETQVNVNVPVFTPPLWGGFDMPKGKVNKQRGTTFNKYTPSFDALLLNIRGRQAKGVGRQAGALYSGQELRPILSGNLRYGKQRRARA